MLSHRDQVPRYASDPWICRLGYKIPSDIVMEGYRVDFKELALRCELHGHQEDVRFLAVTGLAEYGFAGQKSVTFWRLAGPCAGNLQRGLLDCFPG